MWNNRSIEFLKNGNYLEEGETIQERLDAICDVIKQYEGRFKQDGLAAKFRQDIENQYVILSTPQLANVGRLKKEGKKSHVLPCSCNICTPQNSIADLYYTLGEAAMLSKLGAGVGGNYANVSDGGTPQEEGFKTNNKLDWIEDFVRTGQKVSQSSTRRGYTVPFDSIESKHFDKQSTKYNDENNYLSRLSKSNPDKNDPLVNHNMGFSLPVGFRDRVRNGDKEAQRRFLTLMQLRQNIGRNYITDQENMRKNISPVYKALGHIPDSSNICTEAICPSYADKTFACMLLSLNLTHWDHIKDNLDIIERSVSVLDIFVQLYIDLTDGIPFLGKARKSAIEKRDIGLGALGFHDLLQQKMFEFGGLESRRLNKKIYSTIQRVARKKSIELGTKLGPAPMSTSAGFLYRNVSLMMMAPNKSSAFIANQTSEGQNPYLSNYFITSLAGIETEIRNRHLESVLESLNKNTDEVWDSILENLGSVSHLDFLSDHQKSVFRTAVEISPKDIIDLAADRQEFIDMGQSINLWNRPNYTLKDVYDIHMYAFDKGLKTLYYFFPAAHAKLEKNGLDWNDCASCAD